MHAIILSIGDELVLGQTIDTNSAYLSAQLAQRGITTLYHQTVGDDMPSTRDALLQAAGRAPLILITGGLGPTEDDLTRQAMGEAMGVPLVLDEQSLRDIQDYFAKRGRPMADRNRIQAMHPQNSHMIPNTCGTAPGIVAELAGSRIYAMPGVPREMIAMFQHNVVPDLQAMLAARPADAASTHTTEIYTFGWGESTVAEHLADLMPRDCNPTVGTTVSGGIVAIRVRSQFANPVEAQRQLDAAVADIDQRLGPIVFGRDDDTLQDALIALLRQRGQTLATAESCTGGLLGAMLTEVPGSSSVYQGGWITYANETKMRELGIEAALLEQHGAVSPQVVGTMAQNALAQSTADYALTITGIAGPEGGDPAGGKPVGTVYIALADRADVHIMRLQFPSDPPSRTTRQLIRNRSARSAMQMLRLHLLAAPLEHIHWGKLHQHI